MKESKLLKLMVLIAFLTMATSPCLADSLVGAQNSNGRFIPQSRTNLPLYNPYFDLDGTPVYPPYDEPCHYDEQYGQWVGPCTAGQDTPGYSITIPNRWQPALQNR